MQKKEIKAKPKAKSVTKAKKPKKPIRRLTAEGWKRHLFMQAQFKKNNPSCAKNSSSR